MYQHFYAITKLLHMQ